MASIRKLRGKWYSRIQIWDGVKQKERLIPLKTGNKTDARVRNAQVEKVEKDIKNGIEYRFAWLSEKSKTEVVQNTIGSSIDAYRNYRNTNVRPSTVIRDGVALKSLAKTIGYTTPICRINDSSIETYKKHCIENNLKPAGININLRHIKTFLYWCCDGGLIEKRVKIKQLDIGKPLPKYLTEYQFNELMSLDWLDELYKDIFYFYVSTGCRVSEPFIGELVGDWLIVDENHSKNKSVRHIQLNARQIDILNRMQGIQKKSVNSGCRPERITEKLSVVFKKAIRDVGLDDNVTLHSLRHTYAVKRYLTTRDIYLVKEELGHSTVTTTEIYTKFPIQRIASDFPSIIQSNQSSKEMGKNGIKDTDIKDTGRKTYAYSRQ